MRFVDEIEVTVASGAGGHGCIAFRREKYVPRGGPAGGDGGRGGNLIIEATRSRNTLVDIRFNRVYRAKNGENGGRANRTGAAGDPRVLYVPVGTVITDVVHDLKLADLTTEGDQWIIDGGLGGQGNTHFKTSTRRTPRTATDGKPGVSRSIRLELKLLADVGLLGYPNAGKSTLISTISAAKPRVAAHPFTTLVPNLGVVSVEPGVSYVVADIPGLIEGASEGKGLGHRFLKHVERCSLFLHLVSPDNEQGSPIERINVINKELKRFNSELVKRPQLVLLTKTDLLPDDERDALLEQIKSETGVSAMAISSVSHHGITRLIGVTYQALQSIRSLDDQSGQTEQPLDESKK